MKSYDHIVSLGSFCMTAHQIRRRFPDSKALPFDWWVTPTVALQSLIDTQFSELFEPQNMEIVSEAAGEAVMCRRYGLMHYHDFKEAKVGERYVPLAVRAQCASNLSKYSHLVKRLYSLTGRVLFVRLETGYVEHFDNNRDFDARRLGNFVHSLRALLPEAEVDLLLLNCFAESELEGVYSDRLDHYGETTWTGSDRGWDEMWDRQEVVSSAVAEPILLLTA